MATAKKPDPEPKKGEIIPVQQTVKALSDPQKVWEYIINAYFANRKPSTIRNYRKALVAFGAYLGLSNPEDFAATAKTLFALKQGEANAVVFQYRTHMQERKLSGSYINVHLAAVKSLNDIALLLGAIPWKITVESVKVQAYRDTSGPGKEPILKVIGELARKTDAKSARDLAIVRLLYVNGLRRKEVAGLSMDQLDFKKDKIWILGKARSSEEAITINPKTKAALEAWIQHRGTAPGPVFTNFDPTKKGDGRLTGTSIYRIIRSYGLGHPHGLRHTAITEVLDKTNGNVRNAMRFSRHRKPETLMGYDDNRRDTAGEVSGLLDEET